MWVRSIGAGLAATLLGCVYAQPSLAQTGPNTQQAPGVPQERSSPGGAPAPAAAPPAAQGGLFAPSRSNLLGDMGGVRTTLGNYAISLGLSDIEEVFGNVTGGRHRGADYDGLTQMTLGLDTAKAFGWAGGTFNVSALQIHGRNLSTDNLLNLQFASGIEAERSTRLWELWYQQAFGDRFDVKIGQQSIDQEFIISQYGLTFANLAFGYPVLPSFDLYGGGPAYPLSSLGVRVRARPTNEITLLAGVFDDNPGGGPFAADAQRLDASGTRFSLNTGALWIAEAQYALNPPPAQPAPNQPTGLPGTYKFGFWFDSGHFPDQRFDTLGLPLTAAASNGIARLHSGNYTIYAIADQLVWRPNATSPEGVGVFARLMGAPQSDRNLLTLGVNAGLVWKAPFAGRDNDTAGIGMGYAKISSRAAALDRDAGRPARTNETYVELTYQYQVAPWWTLQPDFQYIFNPSGGILNPLNPTKKIGDEAIFGLRTTIVF